MPQPQKPVTPRSADDPARFVPVAQIAVEQRVRDEIWKMEHSEDMSGVMGVVETGLRELGVEFHACGVNIIEPLDDRWRARIYTHYMLGGRELIDVDTAQENAASPVIVKMWQDGEIVYRPDLDAEDRLGERQWIGEGHEFHLRSVLDVPFAYGTLALSSETPQAFSAEDIEIARRMAAVLSEGFSRREDLQKLEHEAKERQRAEEETRINLAVQQVRNEALQMEDEEDWSKVSSVFNAQLNTLVDFYLCGIQHIDELKNAYQAQDVSPPRAGKLTLNDTLPLSLREALETGRYVYRRTRAEMERYGDLIGPEVNSVVDVPFRGGTIAVNSKAENAFSERDVHILERFAQVMSEADRRLQDLKTMRQQEEQLRQAQKMEAIGQLTAGIAHNFNNALAGATVNLYLARRDAAPEIRPLLVETERAVQQASDMVRKLLTYSRRESQTEFRPICLEPLLGNVGSICRKTFDRRIAVDLEIDPALPPVSGDPTQLEQMLLNLCLNARDALAGTPDPAIGIAAREVDLGAAADAPAGAYVLVEVGDNGEGMDEETRAQAFDPFFTTKDVDTGTGLGLSTVYGIVQQHGGRIECDSQPGTGTVFSIYLPTTTAEPVEPSPPEEEVPAGSETVLLIDDEESVRRSMVRLLELSGYRVLLGVDGLDGLEVFKRHRDEIELVILDMSMPRMSGPEVLVELQRLDPGVKVMVFSGYAPEDQKIYEKVMGVFEKPPDPERFLRHVRASIDVKKG